MARLARAGSGPEGDFELVQIACFGGCIEFDHLGHHVVRGVGRFGVLCPGGRLGTGVALVGSIGKSRPGQE